MELWCIDCKSAHFKYVQQHRWAMELFYILRSDIEAACKCTIMGCWKKGRGKDTVMQFQKNENSNERVCFDDEKRKKNRKKTTHRWIVSRDAEKMQQKKLRGKDKGRKGKDLKIKYMLLRHFLVFFGFHRTRFWIIFASRSSYEFIAIYIYVYYNMEVRP